MDTSLIGGKIVKARKAINMSQAQLAQHLFLSPQAVGKWERGESVPDIITFTRLAEILGVDLNYFSENFRSAATEASVAAVTQPAELPSGKQKNKLNWDMSRGSWADADFSGLKNLHEKFSSSNMQRCKFVGSDMAGLLLKSNNIDSCDFSGSDISSSRVQSSNLLNNLFKDCSLKKAAFSGSNINSCDFTGSDINGSHIQSSYLANNLFGHCKLEETEFSGSYITDCNFTGTDFTGTAFRSGGFQNNPVTDAVLNRTSFYTTKIADIVFEGKLEDCYFENCVFTRVTFQNATLTNTFFKCKSLKKLKFINCRADRMTYEFLKNGKADLSGITLVTT